MDQRRRIASTVRSDESGQAAVEFALVVPVLVALLLAVVQMGVTFNHYITVTDAARAGARKAIVARVSSLSKADIEQAVRTSAGDLDQNTLGVNVATGAVAGDDVTVTVTYPYQIDIFGLPLAKGSLTSTMTERLE